MSEIDPYDVRETHYHDRDTQYVFTPSVSDAMRQLRNKGAVAACDNQIFRKHDLDYLDKLYVQDYVDYDIFPGQPPGLEGFKESFKWYLEAFPDLHTVVDFIIAEGDMVVVQGFFEGTQVGPFLGQLAPHPPPPRAQDQAHSRHRHHHCEHHVAEGHQGVVGGQERGHPAGDEDAAQQDPGPGEPAPERVLHRKSGDPGGDAGEASSARVIRPCPDERGAERPERHRPQA